VEFSDVGMEALGQQARSLSRTRNVDPLDTAIAAEAARYELLSSGGEGPPAYDEVA
jgi:hypothetical protein